MDLYKDGLCASLRHAISEFKRSAHENKDKAAIDRWQAKVDDLVAKLEKIERLERKSR